MKTRTGNVPFGHVRVVMFIGWRESLARNPSKPLPSSLSSYRNKRSSAACEPRSNRGLPFDRLGCELCKGTGRERGKHELPHLKNVERPRLPVISL